MVKFIDTCPVCSSDELFVLTKHKFKALKKDIEEFQNFQDNYTDIAKYVLFNEIFNGTKDVLVFWITLCNNCGLLFTNPRLTAKDIKNKYTALDNIVTEEKNALYKNLEKNFFRINSLYNLIRNFHILNGGDKKVLDYGGGAGYMLFPFYKKNSCFILDYIQWSLPEGITYLGKDLDDIDKNEKFDLILLLHTLEHVRNPVDLLSNISSHLKENGKIIIQVPLGSFLEWRNLKEPLTHINFFSEESIYHVVRMAGLEVVFIRTKPQKFPEWFDWEIELIAQKTAESAISLSKVLSTHQQIRRIYYYYLKQLLEIIKYPKYFFIYLRKSISYFRKFIITYL